MATKASTTSPDREVREPPARRVGGESRSDRRLVGEVRDIRMVDERDHQHRRSNSNDGCSESSSRHRGHRVASYIGWPPLSFVLGNLAGGRSRGSSPTGGWLRSSTSRFLVIATSCSSRPGQHMRRGPAVRFARGDMLRDVLGVPPYAGEHVRGRRVEEFEADEVETWLVRHHATFVQGTSVLTEDGEIDPGELLPEPCAPDHIRHVQDASVLEHWATVLYADDPRHLLDSGGDEVLQLDADERRAMGDELGLNLSADGRPQCQYVMTDEPHYGEEEPRRNGSVTDGELSRGLAGQVCGMRAGHLESDLRSGVARAHYQNGTFLEPRGVTVLARMQLHDAPMKLVGEGRDLRDLVGARRDDHVFRFETAVGGCNDESISHPGESVHLDAGSNRQIESGSVGFEVVGHLVLGGK